MERRRTNHWDELWQTSNRLKPAIRVPVGSQLVPMESAENGSEEVFRIRDLVIYQPDHEAASGFGNGTMDPEIMRNE